MTASESGAPAGPAEALFRQLKRSRRLDLNPYRRGFKNEILSLSGSLYPEAMRLSVLTLPFDGDGWMSGDVLIQIADLAEKHGFGICGLHPSENQALIPVGSPAGSDHLVNRFQDEQSRKKNRFLNICSLWGPCLGENAGFLELLEAAASELKDDVGSDFRVSLSACPRDCRRLIERSDLMALADEGGSHFSLWLGGRRRPFRELILPRPLKSFASGEPRLMTDFIFRIQDRFREMREGKETLPEALGRLSEDEFMRFFGL